MQHRVTQKIVIVLRNMPVTQMASCRSVFSSPCPITQMTASLPLSRSASLSYSCRAPCPLQATKNVQVPPLSRRSGNYPLTSWNDGYIQSLENDTKEEHVVRIEKLKEGVRPLLVIEESATEKEIVKQLELVDTLQQLGVAYHFEEEITTVMASISKLSMVGMEQENLYVIALLFRLLREHGFTASQDVFNSFKDGSGSFKPSLCHDIRALLSLYQASYYAMEGEDILDAARDFTTKHLKDSLKAKDGSQIESCKDEHVAYALELPLNWRMQRLHHRWFIERFEQEDKMNPTLLEFAKLDYNRVQSIHKRELSELSRWWTDMGLLGDKLRFSRDRLVENYFCSVGWAFEPKLWRIREVLTKFNCFITTIDDVYDVYGTLAELELFTDVVERWEISAIEQLPEYMKICFLALYNTTNGVGYETIRDNGVDIFPYLKRAWTDLCKAYLVEARWYHSGYTPTLGEYLENGWISISAHIMFTVAYCVNQEVTVEALENFKGYPDIIRWSSTILRLSNDLATSTEELDRGDVPKCIECYMHESGVTETIAREHIRDLIRVNWKKLNAENLSISRLDKIFKSAAFNIQRTAQCIYQHGDGYGKQPDRETKDRVISLLIEPILL